MAAEVIEEQMEQPQESMTENVAEAQQEAAVEEQVETQQGAELTPQQEAAIDVQTETQQPMMEQPAAGQPEQTAMMEATVTTETTGSLPKSGGLGIGSPSVLLPTVALLLGSGILAFAALRRR